MSKHLADHRALTQGGRMKHFLRIARETASDAVWRGLWQKPAMRAEGNRRVVEYVRIARGREV